MKKKTHAEYLIELSHKAPTIEVIEPYVNHTTPILHHCMKHDIFWRTTPGRVLSGKGCKQCGKEKFRESRCKTNEQYVDELKIKLPHIIPVDKYIDKSTHIMHYCTKHDIFWNATPDNVLHSAGCKLCKGDAIGDKLKKTHDQYIEELNLINKNIEVKDRYIGANIPILHKCKIDNHEWFATPANILFGRGCPECKSRMLANMFVKSHSDYVLQVAISNPDIEVVEQYINAKTPILHRCKKDKHTWKAIPSNILSGQGCPLCQESNGERYIRQWLDNQKIEYKYQKTFIDCKDKKLLPFDFYLPKYNTCVEYDGRQHFEPVDFASHGEEWALNQLKETQLHDEIKNQYCKEHNIHLLRIQYFKNVEEELEKFLFI